MVEKEAAEAAATNKDFFTLLGENWLIIAIIIIFAVIIYFLISRRNKDQITFKEFKPQPLKKTLNESLKDKTKLFGRKFSGKLFISFYPICRIDRYFKIKGTFEVLLFDERKKDFSTTKEDGEQYDLIILRALSKNFLKALFGFGKYFIIIKLRDKKGNPQIKFDHVNKSIILNEGMDLTSYGEIWSNCHEGIEYLNDISVKRMLEQTQMYLENNPDKVIHLEMEQAKRERIKRVEAEIEKSKWKERETAGDTTIV